MVANHRRHLGRVGKIEMLPILQIYELSASLSLARSRAARFARRLIKRKNIGSPEYYHMTCIGKR